MTTQRLLPCPFCGGADAKTTSNGEESYSAFCESCGCEGPTASTTNAAAEAWNRRAASAVQAKPDAWLITGSLAYHDDAVLTEAEADRCIAGRGKHDQSFKAPLYLQLPAADGTTPRELLEALEPFAAFLDAMEHMGGCFPKSGTVYHLTSHMVGDRELTVEDFKAARAAIAKAPGKA